MLTRRLTHGFMLALLILTTVLLWHSRVKATDSNVTTSTQSITLDKASILQALKIDQGVGALYPT